MKDVFGRALLDYLSGEYAQDIITFSTVAGEDRLPLPYLFRDYDDMPQLEQHAIGLCDGHILDVGCGAGSHALYLQQKGLNITGLDISDGAIETCGLRGLKKTVNGTIYDLDGMKFDTILLLMNGIGIAGTLSELDALLIQIKKLLAPQGQVILDSSDIIYMFEAEEIEKDKWIAATNTYYGEVTFEMVYKGMRSEPFAWLYLDFNTLKEHTSAHGLACEFVMAGKHYDYLARLSFEK